MKVFFKGLFFTLFAFLVVSCSDIFSGRDEYADVELNLNTAVARESSGGEFYTTLIIKLLNVKSKKVELERNFNINSDFTGGRYSLPKVKSGTYILLIQVVDNYGCIYNESRQMVTVSSKGNDIVSTLEKCLVTDFASLKTRVEAINNNALIRNDELQTIVVNFTDDTDTFVETIEVKKNIKVITPMIEKDGVYNMWQINRGKNGQNYFTGPAFKVADGATLILDEGRLDERYHNFIVIDGQKDTGATAVNALIESKGTLIINKNCMLQNNYNNKIDTSNNNNPQGYGGAIYAKGSKCALEFYGTIQNCSANVGGGAICVETFDSGTGNPLNRPATISGNITGHATSRKGGAIYIKGASVTITDAEIDNSVVSTTDSNYTKYNGNAIYGELGGKLNMVNAFANLGNDTYVNYIMLQEGYWYKLPTGIEGIANPIAGNDEISIESSSVVK